MERGAIPIEEIPGGIDLEATLESGQSFLWRRENGDTYGDHDGGGWYATDHEGEIVRVRRRGDELAWEATTDAVPFLRERLRLDDDLDAIVEASPDDDLLAEAYETHRGLRLVRDPFFPCLISFICSAQMRVERIFEMQSSLRERFGDEIEFDGRAYHAFPTPDRLAQATEAELRELGLGYRAPYVRETATMVAKGALTRKDVPESDYEAARDALTEFVGVGPKVADCVCLFSLGHLEAVPLDTWIRTAIEEYYPDRSKDGYAETSRAIREALGPYPGYAQTYVFHHLRTR